MRPILGTISTNSITNREATLPSKSETPSYTNLDSHQFNTTGSSNKQLNPPYRLGSTTYPNYFRTTSRSSNITIDQRVRNQQQYLQQYEENLLRRSNKQCSSMDSQPNDWFGDTIKSRPGWDTGSKMTTLRVGCVNINGISQDLDFLEWEMIMRNLSLLQMDVFGFTEPDINFNNNSVLSKLYDATRAYDQSMQLAYSCSNQLNHKSRKKGGTLMTLAGRWAVRKRHTGKDKYGRWSYITIDGKRDTRVTIITAYRVCPQRRGVGCTIFHQQQLDFEENNTYNIDLRKQFILDMTTFVQSLHSEGHTVILMGDMNDDLNDANGDISNMLRACGLTNIMKSAFGKDTQLPPTYVRGTRNIDLISISTSFDLTNNTIIRAGYFPFHHHFCTDHRILYVDIDLNQLLGNISPDVTHSSSRSFSTNNVEKSKKFRKIVTKLYKKAKINEALKKIDKAFLLASTPRETQLAIDMCIKYEKVCSDLLLHAGKKIAKKPYKHGKPYSDALVQAARNLHTAKHDLSALRRSPPPMDSKDKTDHLITRIKQAYTLLKDVQRDAEKLRESFLLQLADKRAQEWNLTSSAALNVIIASESSRKTYARHGRYMTNVSKGGIRAIAVPNPQYGATIEESERVGWMEIDNIETMFSLILRQNAKLLMRSSNTPFATGTLPTECGFDGDGDMATTILNGTLSQANRDKLSQEYPNLSEELDAFILALARPRDDNGNIIPDFQWKFGKEEFKRTFRRTRENTACGPSGLNMSYWKVLTESDSLATIHAYFIEKAFQYGFSYPRWQVSWHCMLKKKPIPYIHRLRIIQLFEGDFNGALKYLLGRLLMYHIVNTKQSNSQAFGSIPGKTSHEALLSLQLLYDNARLTKTNMATIFNDAAGCYDRIRPLLSDLCMRRSGCPISLSRCHTTTQRKMQHFVKTAKGVSDGKIVWGPNDATTQTVDNGVLTITGNIGGIGQGGGGSPVGWFAVLMVMIEAFSTFEDGITMQDPLSTLTLVLHIISYVDDNTLVKHFDSDVPIEDIISKLSCCLSRWHKILQITGGNLALEKCTFSLLYWKWSKGLPSLYTKDTKPGNLLVEGTTIMRLDAHESSRVLGIRMAMDGSFQDELQFRISQSKKLAQLLYNSPLSRLDSYMVYQTRFLPALQYPLPITTFTSKEIDMIQKPFIFSLLPKIGINRHAPRSIIYGPMAYGGLGITSLEVYQVTKHIELFQGHLRRCDEVATSLRIQLATQQLEIGCGTFFLNNNPKLFPYTNQSTRLYYLWRQLYKHNITVRMLHAWDPAGDNGAELTIMDVAVHHAEFNSKPSILHSINRCRLFLKLMWVRDLLLPDQSTFLDKNLLAGTQPLLTPSLSFPYQSQPTLRDLAIWKKFTYRCFCGNNFQLCLPLPDSRPIYGPIPSDLHTLSSALRTAPTLQSKLQQLPAKFRDLTGIVNVPCDDGVSLINALKKGQVSGASDGSYKDTTNTGTHAFLLSDSTYDINCITGSAYSPTSDMLSSSQAEHYGLLGLLIVLFTLLNHHNEDGLGWPTLTIFIDNLEVVNRFQTPPSKMNIKQLLTHDFDLWVLLHKFKQYLRLPLEVEWIKSHQDLAESQDIPGVLLNHEADNLATTQHSCPAIIPTRSFYTAGVIAFYHNNVHMQNISSTIIQHITANHIRSYYRSKGWTDTQLNYTDWNGMELFLTSLTPTTRVTAIKLIHNWHNTGAQKKKFLPSPPSTSDTASAAAHQVSLCPLQCNQVEDNLHYLTCTAPSMVQHRQSSLLLLTKGLRKLKTSPILILIMKMGISAWNDGVELELDDTTDPRVFSEDFLTLIHEQNLMGWDKLLRGFISKQWGYAQEKYYSSQSLSSRTRTRTRWVTSTLRLLHQYRQRLWSHRNTSLHGGKTTQSHLLQRHGLISEIKRLYTLPRSHLTTQFPDLFCLSLRQRLRQGNQLLQLWIHRALLAFKTCPYDKNEVGCQRNITEWIDGWMPAAETSTPLHFDDHKALRHYDYIESQSKNKKQYYQPNITKWFSQGVTNAKTKKPISCSAT